MPLIYIRDQEYIKREYITPAYTMWSFFTWIVCIWILCKNKPLDIFICIKVSLTPIEIFRWGRKGKGVNVNTNLFDLYLLLSLSDLYLEWASRSPELDHWLHTILHYIASVRPAWDVWNPGSKQVNKSNGSPPPTPSLTHLPRKLRAAHHL